MALIPTLLTPKLSLRRAIPSLNVSTFGAFLAGVSRSDKTHIYTFRFSLISDECLKLSKTPSMQTTTLSLPHFGSTANVREVFKNQRCARPNRLNQSLRKHMVAIFTEPFLSARKFFKMSFSRFRAFAFQSPTQLKCCMFYLLPIIRTVLAPSAINSRRNNTQVHTYNLIGGNGFWSFDFHNNVQPPPPFAVFEQVCTGILPVQILLIIFRNFKGQFYPSIDAKNRHFTTVKPDRLRPGIVPNWAAFRGWTANRLALLLQALSRFQSLGGFDPSSTDQLTRQASESTMVVVGRFVQSYAICQVVFPSIFAHSIKRPGVLLNRLRQHFSRFDVGLKLDANCSLDTHIIFSYSREVICEWQRLCVDFGGIKPPKSTLLSLPHLTKQVGEG